MKLVTEPSPDKELCRLALEPTEEMLEEVGLVTLSLSFIQRKKRLVSITVRPGGKQDIQTCD